MSAGAGDPEQVLRLDHQQFVQAERPCKGLGDQLLGIKPGQEVEPPAATQASHYSAIPVSRSMSQPRSADELNKISQTLDHHFEECNDLVVKAKVEGMNEELLAW